MQTIRSGGVHHEQHIKLNIEKSHTEQHTLPLNCREVYLHVFAVHPRKTLPMNIVVIESRSGFIYCSVSQLYRNRKSRQVPSCCPWQPPVVTDRKRGKACANRPDINLGSEGVRGLNFIICFVNTDKSPAEGDADDWLIKDLEVFLLSTCNNGNASVSKKRHRGDIRKHIFVKFSSPTTSNTYMLLFAIVTIRIHFFKHKCVWKNKI